MRRQINTTLSAKVRAYLGLSQLDLSRCLEISRALVAQAETRRCDYGIDARLRLLALAELVWPSTSPASPEGEAGPTPDLDPTLLHSRLRSCEREARQLRRKLEQAKLDPQYAHRWQQVLPVLEATLPADPATDTPGQRRLRRWLPLRSADMADTLDSISTTERRMLQLRLRLLETEAAELRSWLPTPSGPAAAGPA